MDRSKWRGLLKVSLVEIPVRLLAASESGEKIKFHRLHAVCCARMQSKSWCGTCNEEVPHGDTVRGYEHRKGEHVVLTDEELETVADNSSQALTITSVVHPPVDPIYIDTTGYLMPDGTAAEGAFETLRVALGLRIAVGTLVLRGASTRVALEGRDRGFLVYQLRPHTQVRAIAEVSRSRPSVGAPGAGEVAMARKLFTSIVARAIDYADIKDEHAVRVMALVAAKVTGKAMPAAATKKPVVSSLHAALAQSLAAARPRPTVVPHRKTVAS